MNCFAWRHPFFDCYSISLLAIAGLIGKITLQIPLGRLDKEWIITIEDLFIVAGPDENMEVS